MIQTPATAGIVALCIGVYLWLAHKNLGYESVGISYRSFTSGEYWRSLTASLSHIDLLQLVFNMSSLWSLRFLEHQYGPLWYLRLSFLLLIGSIAAFMGLYWFLIAKLRMNDYANVISLGYSCVVFGVMTVAHQLTSTKSFNLFGLQIPLSLMPFGSLLLTQIIVPRASFVGHLSGIIIGYLYSFGLFRWFDYGFFVFALFWYVIMILYSVKLHSPLSLPWIRCGTEEQLRDIRIEGGVILPPARTPPRIDM